MVLMAEGMTFILHHSSDLGDGDAMGVIVGTDGLRIFTISHLDTLP